MRYLLIFALLVAAHRSLAIDDTPANRLSEAQRYLATTPPRDLFADIAEQMTKNAPPKEKEIIMAIFTKHLDVEALTKAMTDAMVKHFTADELHALAEFYGSPVGKSAMKKFGVYMTDVMPAIQVEMGKVQEKMAHELAEQVKTENQPAAKP